MKLLNCIVCILIISNTLFSQVSKIKWIKTAIGSKDDWARLTKTDHEGNIYVFGEFDSRNLLIDGLTLENKSDSSINSFTNLFLIKYNKDGNLMWLKSIQSDGTMDLPSISVSPSGSIAISYDLLNGSSLKFSNVELNIPKYFFGMVINYLDDIGNIQWYKVLLDNVTCSNTAGIVIDHNEDVIIGGNTFSGTIKDEEGNYLIKDSIINHQAFLLKFDKSGQAIWGNSFGSNSTDYLSAITVDNLNNIVVSGSFHGYQFVIDNFTALNRSKINGIEYWYDIFLAKLNSDGNALWLNSIYGSKDDVSADKIVTDIEGNIFLAGGFDSDTIYFNEMTKLYITKPRQAGVDLFYSKYNVDGELQWANKLNNGGSGVIEFITLTVSPNGRLFLAGNYDNTGFRTGEIVLPSYGFNDVFYFECDSLGNIISKGSLGSDDYEWITDIHMDHQSNLYLLGNYGSKELKLGNTTLRNTSSDGSTDMYLVKICPDSLISTKNPNDEQIIELVYFPDQKAIKIVGNERLEKGQLYICDISGKFIFHQSIDKNVDFISIPNLLSGVYLVNLRTVNGFYATKIVHD
ncbi:MAG: T9SS type A sorting domain-containing protein [Saprospiraceae bacterium]|nr:T9SS type A sorting domain-containing protein [Saprospiraceae bacterium]